MKVFWWNGGLHLEPVGDGEREALLALTANVRVLELVEPALQIATGPIGAVSVHDEQAVGRVQPSLNPDPI